MIAATIRVRRPSGALDRFQAETCSIEGDAVHVVGVWVDKSGRRSDVQRYTFVLSRCLEIRWAEPA